MKIKYLFSFLILAFCPDLFAQSPNWAWTRTDMASGNYGNEGFCVATDLNGNVFATGWMQSPAISFGPFSLTNTSVGHSDIFLTKYDANGNVLWAKSAGGTENDRAYSVATDAAGNVFIAGCFYSPTVIFGTDTLVNSSADDDIFLAKYDANGNVLWARRAGAGGDDRALYVTTDASGNAAITGRFNSSTLVFGSSVLTNTSLFDLFLAKYDPNGNVLWADGFGGTNNDYGYSVTSQNGHFYLTGEFDSPSITFGSTLLTTAGFGDIFLVHVDAAGNVVWAKNTGGTGLECGNSVTIDAVGNLYVAGYFYSPSVTFGTSTIVNAVSNSASSDVCFFKYDSNGNPIWAKSAGTVGSEAAYAASVDPKSNVYFAGKLENFPVTFSTLTMTTPVGSSDPMFIVSYDSSGVLICGQALASGGDDNNSVAAFAAGQAFVGGDYASSPFIIGNDTLMLSSWEDVFVARFNCNGLDAIPTLQSDAKQLLIYPNPSNGKFTIENQLNDPGMRMEIYTVTGQKILSQQIAYGKSELDLPGQENGIYFVWIKTEKDCTVRKVILQR